MHLRCNWSEEKSAVETQNIEGLGCRRILFPLCLRLMRFKRNPGLVVSVTEANYGQGQLEERVCPVAESLSASQGQNAGTPRRPSAETLSANHGRIQLATLGGAISVIFGSRISICSKFLFSNSETLKFVH